MTDGSHDEGEDLTARLIADLARRGETVAVAESLTGGLLAAELIRPAGASSVVFGAVVAYNTSIKATVLGVDATLLRSQGPVHPEVAEQMAEGVRFALSVDGSPASIGISTTGVAGPGPQDGHAEGTVYVGLAVGDKTSSFALHLTGSRDQIRAAAVSEAVRILRAQI
ncbi:nicotinamide-nucleotide amidohydrolase family protein [Subtercola sp. RTI3]|uniref:CinA family protein n=1 Tax=Subtercola sp. RTI3 TaxID=3048639 RepID=UPI002B22B3A3|nr:nicotinamide-nucleotide amidohydrolase family protein [Subtercola sp. RTI3]MEA9985318.1 nicotinamide-nucleotide amidohydrolase family protein [Subtercola sp. RTI3]